MSWLVCAPLIPSSKIRPVVTSRRCQPPALTGHDLLRSTRRQRRGNGFTGIEKFGVDQCPRCVETYDFATHEPFRQFRVFHLFAQGDGTSGLQQFCNIALGRVIGHSAKGNRIGAGFVAGGESNGQQLGGGCASS